jgi:hypothetical protein
MTLPVMAGKKVHVFRDNQLVVSSTTLEDCWKRDKPFCGTGRFYAGVFVFVLEQPEVFPSSDR